MIYNKKISTLLCIFFSFFLSPHYLVINQRSPLLFIVWNVGQGSWSSLIGKEVCFHFDMGGKRQKKKNKIIEACKKKQNILLLTHADTDHINLSYLFSSIYIKFCLYKKPREELRPRNKRYLNKLVLCNKKELLLLKKYQIKEIFFSVPKKIFYQKSSRSNFLSRIFIIRNQILIGGDSTKKAELLWKGNILYPKKIKYFVLNHHGSKHSNHIALLKTFKNLKIAIASAKKSKYKHPHKELVDRLKKLKIGLLQTEVWGNLYFYLDKY